MLLFFLHFLHVVFLLKSLINFLMEIQLIGCCCSYCSSNNHLLVRRAFLDDGSGFFSIDLYFTICTIMSAGFHVHALAEYNIVYMLLFECKKEWFSILIVKRNSC